MDWTTVARRLVALGAPMLGSALAGPLGGAAGQLLAEALGAREATPKAVAAALPQADPECIAAAEARWIEMVRAEAETQRAAIGETQATIRAELASNDVVQRWWRPAYAWELTLECAALWLVVVRALWSGDAGAINALAGASGLLISYWAFRFGVLGVYVSGRSREKLAAVGENEAGGLLGRLVKTVKKK